MNVTAVAIVAIASYALVSVIQTIFKKRDNSSQTDKEQTNQTLMTMQDEIKALKSRVETLEKIVTDDKYQLNKQFEDLKNK